MERVIEVDSEVLILGLTVDVAHNVLYWTQFRSLPYTLVSLFLENYSGGIVSTVSFNCCTALFYSRNVVCLEWGKIFVVYFVPLPGVHAMRAGRTRL